MQISQHQVHGKLRAASVFASVVMLSACDHTTPYHTSAPDPLGPVQAELPRRLTFSQGDDRTPSVQGETVAFSRREATRPDSDRCLQFLPVEGGTLTGTACPGGPLSVPDTMFDTWLLPSLSPDQNRVAYVRESGIIVNVVPASRQLVIAPATAPESAAVLVDTPYRLTDGRAGNQFDAIEWAGPTTVRFIAGLEIVDGLTRPADTTFLPYAIVDVDVATHAITTIAGTDGAFTYVTAPNGGFWYARRRESIVRSVSAEGSADVVDFGFEIRSLTEAAGMPVAIVMTPGPVDPVPTVMSGNLETGVFRTIWTGLYPVRLARVPGRPWVVAAIHRDERPTRLGGGASLWLLEVR